VEDVRFTAVRKLAPMLAGHVLPQNVRSGVPGGDGSAGGGGAGEGGGGEAAGAKAARAAAARARAATEAGRQGGAPVAAATAAADDDFAGYAGAGAILNAAAWIVGEFCAISTRPPSTARCWTGEWGRASPQCPRPCRAPTCSAR
jgi:hypothetical protein